MKKIRKQKVHSLTGRITWELMHQAYKAVKRNRGAAGIDKVSIKMFDANRDENLRAVMRGLKNGSFKPKPLRRAYIAKDRSRKKLRPLGIPAVRDRVAQEVIRRLLNPIFERLFHDHSYGFRLERSCHQAIEKVLEIHGQGYHVVLDADIQGFFDNISHRAIMQLVAAEIADGNILRLIEKFLRSGVMENGCFKPTTIGTPQGGVISPLLANVVLNQLDWRLQEAGYRFVRYADDFVVLCRSHQQAEEALTYVRKILDELGLTLSPDKTKVTTYGRGYDFLGFHLSSQTRRMRDKSVEKFKDKVRELTQRRFNFDKQMIAKLNQVIRGTAYYFNTGFSTERWRLQRLDQWIRMRLRCVKFKRKSRSHNQKLKVSLFETLGLLSLAATGRNL